MKKLVALCSVLVVGCGVIRAAGPAPNLIVILADLLGDSDPGSFGGSCREDREPFTR